MATLRLSVGISSSSRGARAQELASTLPGFARGAQSAFELTLDTATLSSEQVTTLHEVVQIVRTWQKTSFEVDGAPLGRTIALNVLSCCQRQGEADACRRRGEADGAARVHGEIGAPCWRFDSSPPLSWRHYRAGAIGLERDRFRADLVARSRALPSAWCPRFSLAASLADVEGFSRRAAERAQKEERAARRTWVIEAARSAELAEGSKPDEPDQD